MFHFIFQILVAAVTLSVAQILQDNSMQEKNPISSLFSDSSIEPSRFWTETNYENMQDNNSSFDSVSELSSSATSFEEILEEISQSIDNRHNKYNLPSGHILSDHETRLKLPLFGISNLNNADKKILTDSTETNVVNILRYPQMSPALDNKDESANNQKNTFETYLQSDSTKVWDKIKTVTGIEADELVSAISELVPTSNVLNNASRLDHPIIVEEIHTQYVHNLDDDLVHSWGEKTAAEINVNDFGGPISVDILDHEVYGEALPTEVGDIFSVTKALTPLLNKSQSKQDPKMSVSSKTNIVNVFTFNVLSKENSSKIELEKSLPFSTAVDTMSYVTTQDSLKDPIRILSMYQYKANASEDDNDKKSDDILKLVLETKYNSNKLKVSDAINKQSFTKRQKEHLKRDTQASSLIPDAQPSVFNELKAISNIKPEIELEKNYSEFYKQIGIAAFPTLVAGAALFTYPMWFPFIIGQKPTSKQKISLYPPPPRRRRLTKRAIPSEWLSYLIGTRYNNGAKVRDVIESWGKRHQNKSQSSNNNNITDMKYGKYHAEKNTIKPSTVTWKGEPFMISNSVHVFDNDENFSSTTPTYLTCLDRWGYITNNCRSTTNPPFKKHLINYSKKDNTKISESGSSEYWFNGINTFGNNLDNNDNHSKYYSSTTIRSFQNVLKLSQQSLPVVSSTESILSNKFKKTTNFKKQETINLKGNNANTNWFDKLASTFNLPEQHTNHSSLTSSPMLDIWKTTQDEKKSSIKLSTIPSKTYINNLHSMKPLLKTVSASKENTNTNNNNPELEWLHHDNGNIKTSHNKYNHLFSKNKYINKYSTTTLQPWKSSLPHLNKTKNSWNLYQNILEMYTTTLKSPYKKATTSPNSFVVKSETKHNLTSSTNFIQAIPPPTIISSRPIMTRLTNNVLKNIKRNSILGNKLIQTKHKESDESINLKHISSYKMPMTPIPPVNQDKKPTIYDDYSLAVFPQKSANKNNDDFSMLSLDVQNFQKYDPSSTTQLTASRNQNTILTTKIPLKNYARHSANSGVDSKNESVHSAGNILRKSPLLQLFVKKINGLENTKSMNEERNKTIPDQIISLLKKSAAQFTGLSTATLAYGAANMLPTWLPHALGEGRKLSSTSEAAEKRFAVAPNLTSSQETFDRVSLEGSQGDEDKIVNQIKGLLNKIVITKKTEEELTNPIPLLNNTVWSENKADNPEVAVNETLENTMTQKNVSQMEAVENKTMMQDDSMMDSNLIATETLIKEDQEDSMMDPKLNVTDTSIKEDPDADIVEESKEPISDPIATTTIEIKPEAASSESVTQHSVRLGAVTTRTTKRTTTTTTTTTSAPTTAPSLFSRINNFIQTATAPLWFPLVIGKKRRKRDAKSFNMSGPQKLGKKMSKQIRTNQFRSSVRRTADVFKFLKKYSKPVFTQRVGNH